MKKIILLLMAIFVLSVLFSCGDETPKSPDESSNETVSGDVAETEGENKEEQPKRLSEEEKAKYYKVIEYDLPEGNFRDAIVDYMRKCASIKWVASKDFGMDNVFGNNDWSVHLTYKKGETYYGLPYTDYFVNYDYFEDLVDNGKYAPTATGWQEAPGLNCYTSILAALQQFYISEGWTADWVPGQKTFLLETVGPYKAPESPQSTEAICEANGKDVMFESYMQLQKGDIVYRKDFNKQDYLHCRVVVEEPTIVKNGAGKVIPSRSYVKCIEQTNTFDTTRADGAKTTWYVDHTYSFDALYDTDFVPLTLPIYSQSLSEAEVPYLALDVEITPAILAKKTFSSMVKSNFPLRFIRVDVLDKSGNVVVTKEEGNFTNLYKLALRNKFSSVFDGLTDGEYTFVLTAGISRGSAELARVDFTHSK